MIAGPPFPFFDSPRGTRDTAVVVVAVVVVVVSLFFSQIEFPF